MRIAERQGWDVEFIAEKRTVTVATRDEALAIAKAAAPAWIELGEVVPAGPATPQHHSWTTLRRTADGGYVPSRLAWGGPPPDATSVR